MEEIAYLGHWTITDENSSSYKAVERAMAAGIRRIHRLSAFKWWEAVGSITLEEGRMAYSPPDNTDRLDVESFKRLSPSGSISRLEWQPELKTIDLLLAPSWRFDEEVRGSPTYLVPVGREIWIAPIPNADGLGTLEFEYWRTEDLSDPDNELLLLDRFLDTAVHAALAEGLKGKDDSDQRYYASVFMNTDIPDLLSSPDIGEHDDLGGSDLADTTRAQDRYQFYDYAGGGFYRYSY